MFFKLKQYFLKFSKSYERIKNDWLEQNFKNYVKK